MAIVVQKENCIGCGACISICPVGAIEFEANGKAEIGENCIIAAGTLITERKKIPPNSMVMGSM